MPMQEKPPVVHPGMKFRRKTNNIVYIVRKITGNVILLKSEDGTVLTYILLDRLEFSDLEPIYD